MTDHYELLGLARTATAAEVRKAYAQIARERHPDRFTDPVERERAQEFFKLATAAFNALSNERSRREYDDSLARPQVVGPAEIARQAYERGLAQLDAHANHEAVELLRTAVSHAPEQARYRSTLAVALARNPHWAREAIQEAEKAVQLEPAAAVHQGILAELLLGQGLKLRARRAAEGALSLDPREARARRVLQETLEDEPPPDAGLLGRLRRKP
jgi:Tfp pilus assembly protein PilF